MPLVKIPPSYSPNQADETRKGDINFVRIFTKMSVEPAPADSFFAERFSSFSLGKQRPIKKFYSLNPAISNIG
jgi:hypothetical protein